MVRLSMRMVGGPSSAIYVVPFHLRLADRNGRDCPFHGGVMDGLPAVRGAPPVVDASIDISLALTVQ